MATLLWRTNTHGTGAARGADPQGASVGKDSSTLYDDLAALSGAPKRAPSPAPSSSLRKARSAFDLSPRLGTTDDGFFSWKRWYGSTSSPPQDAVPAAPSSDEVSRLVRDALRRRREADDDVSLASSAASSHTSGASTDSPASSSGTWDTSASESSKAATAAPLRSSGYDQEDLDGLPTLAYGTCASSRLRAAQSVATLKAPRMIRRVSSSASISPVPVELPPRSPHGVTSPTFSPMFDDDPFAALAEAPAFPPSSPTLEPIPTSFRSRLASSLRKSASSITLRNPLRSSPSSPVPPVPTLPPSCTTSSSAAAILRDLLLKHDSVVDPSTEPLSSLFDPTLAPLAQDEYDHAEADDSRRYYSSSSDDEPDGDGGASSSDESASFLSHHTDGDDDPFRATAPAYLAWMAPAASTRREARAPQDDEPGALDSPSSAFPPFDPFALADLGPAPPLPLPFALAHAQATAAATPQRVRARPPPPARIITKQRSFVDPRTRQLRTAPSVCVTPSTPEKKRFGLGVEREAGAGES
ncbi:hypothetical protein JCM8208_000573 [Rhodotorula glutinis]